MNPDINHILHHFFQKKTLEEVHVVDIEQMVNEYPYFAPAQYLLAKKYLQTDHAAYLKQAKKTALFFNNPHWLNSLLHAEEIRLDDDGWIDNAGLPVTTETVTPALIDEPVQTTESILIPEEIPENKAIVAVDDNAVVQYEEPTEDISGVVFMEEVNTAADSIIENKATVAAEDNAVVQYEEPTEDISGVVFMEEVNTAADSIIENKQKDIVVEEVLPAETTISTIEPAETSFSTTAPLVTEFAEDVNTDNAELIPAHIISAPKLKLILNQDVPPETGAGSIIPIEPLYTIDYFASQGIKADTSAETKDKLSVKLRSFTDWLKTMKRIHPEKFNTDMDPGSQSAIQHIAEHSNESKDIVTETMAEVFARQGLHKKAAEVYHKLSLLNPDKRVYFAAKIAQLKET